MPKLKTGHISPSPKTDARTRAGIAKDKDSPELDAQWFSKAKPAQKVMAKKTLNALVQQRTRGRPPAEKVKVPTTIRLDEEVLDQFKATGARWQTRINNALKQYLKDHPIKA